MINTEGFPFPATSAIIISGVLQQQDWPTGAKVIYMPSFLRQAGPRSWAQQISRKGNQVATRKVQRFRTETMSTECFARAEVRDGLRGLDISRRSYAHTRAHTHSLMYTQESPAKQVISLPEG
jgi:hypothetical protein